MSHVTHKDRRKQLRGAKAVDPQCRNNGDCPICNGNRQRKNEVRKQAADSQLDELLSNP